MFDMKYDKFVKKIIDQVRGRLADMSMTTGNADAAKENEKTLQLITETVAANASRERNQSLNSPAAIQFFSDYVVKDIFRLGPLEELLMDDSITEIMVNGPAPKDIFIERSGKLQNANIHFFNDDHIVGFIQKIAKADEKSCDNSSPLCDCMLRRPGEKFDGSRCNLTLKPISIDHPTMTIRKFRSDALTPDDLLSFGTFDKKTFDLIQALARGRMNIIVIGGTGSGKTTLLNMLSGSIQKDQRIITIEDNAELQLKDHPHVLRMQARAANSEGVGQVTIRQMLANALRQRPDRIIVGECRGGEALDMLEAMSTGHDGSLTTVHANDARECVSRMQVLISYAGMNLPADLIAQMFSLAVDFVVATKRYPDGSRHVSEIVEIRDMDTTTGQVTMQPIIEFRQYGRDEKGKIKGIFASTGQGFSRYHRDKFEGNGVSVKNAWFKNTPQEDQILSNLRR